MSYVTERYTLPLSVKQSLYEKTPQFGFNGFGEAVYYRCVAKGTKVLTEDLRWVPAETLKIGDGLIGVDEHSSKSNYRKLRASYVEDVSIKTDDCFVVHTSEGSIVVSTEHPFLVQKAGAYSHNEWIKVEQLRQGDGICFIGRPWENESGDSWLAGILDGEGTIGHNSGIRVSIAQNEKNYGIIQRAFREIEERGFQPKWYIDNNNRDNTLINIQVQGCENVLRFLGSVQPQRLVKKFFETLDKANAPYPTRTPKAVVYGVEPVGQREIVSMQTSTRTFIAEGFICHNTYSRKKHDGTQETWPDTVLRVVEGNISIAKDYCVKNRIEWHDDHWDMLAASMAEYIFDMKFLPPGRSLWALGTEYVYERGSAALQNCGFVDVKDSLAHTASWAMDMLMCGIGIGFSTDKGETLSFHPPEDMMPNTYFVPDSREGWVDSVFRLIQSYEVPRSHKIVFDYSRVRPQGAPIHGFGGTASGPEPLRKAHERIRSYLDAFVRQEQTSTSRLIVDVMNAIGACVVAGNVRRSAELATGSPDDETFLNLKNYEMFPERADIGWMSNNSILLRQAEDFLKLPDIVERIKDNGEPGLINMMNVQKYGRFKEKKYGIDRAVGFNPCGEQPLESFELCCLVETFPTRCKNEEEIYWAMHLATIFATNVSLLPTHRPETNVVMERNRRIGVSISGIADFLEANSVSYLTKVFRHGYEEVVRPTRSDLTRQYHIPNAIRVTTIKPSGTISLLAGVSPGMHWPTDRYSIRRMRVSEHETAFIQTLVQSGYTYEQDKYSDNTVVFSFPIDQSKTRSAREVTMWEQFSLDAFLQREWSDNSVSCTIYFNPEKESQDLEHALSMYIPQLKAVSILPHTEEGVYEQAPYERLTEEAYRKMQEELMPIDWNTFVLFGDSDGQDSKFCANDTCEIVLDV